MNILYLFQKVGKDIFLLIHKWRHWWSAHNIFTLLAEGMIVKNNKMWNFMHQGSL